MGTLLRKFGILEHQAFEIRIRLTYKTGIKKKFDHKIYVCSLTASSFLFCSIHFCYMHRVRMLHLFADSCPLAFSKPCAAKLVYLYCTFFHAFFMLQILSCFSSKFLQVSLGIQHAFVICNLGESRDDLVKRRTKPWEKMHL